MSKNTVAIIDARMINLGKNHGISRYTFEIINRAASEIQKKLILLSATNHESLNRFFGKKVKAIINLKSEFLNPYENIEIPMLIKKLKNDIKEELIYFSPSFCSPPFIDIKKYITIHDLMHIDFYKGPKNILYYNTLVKNFVKKCEYVFTVSRYSKKKIEEIFNVSNVKVIYPGVDTFCRMSDNEIEIYRKQLNIESKFFLFIGNEKPHKNANYAYSLFKCLKKYYPSHKFVTNVEICDDDDVIYLQKVDDEILKFLYSSCEAFIYPSLYEGFGLPPLEALSCGSIVISSNKTSLPEVLHEYAIYIDVDKKPEEVCEKVVNELKSTKMDYEQIQNYIKKFNWNRTSEEILKVIFE